MLTRLRALLLTFALGLAIPGVAAAAQPNDLLLVQAGPLATPWSMSTVPQGWGSSAAQAIAAAEHDGTLRALHRRIHPLHVVPFVWRGSDPYWYVQFTYHGKVVATANVSRAGKLTGLWTGPQAVASYTHGGVPPVVDGWFILLPASLLFMAAFFDPGRLRSIAVLDGLAVLSFLMSFEFLAHAQLEPAVWLAYPPLLYLLGRLLKLGFGRPGASARLAPLLGMRVLLVGLPVLLAGRIVLSLVGHQEVDVGWESLIGASRIVHHLPVYWNDPSHGDTYGPVTYLAYVPFQLLFPWSNAVGGLPGADLAAIFFDLGTIGALVLLGRRLRSGAEGTRVGLVLAWAWAACPFTIIGLVEHTNDGLVAMLSVLALVVISSPLVTGAMLGLAAAAKFSPAGLLPLLAAPRQRGVKGALVCVGAFIGVLASAIVVWLPPRGLGYFWQRTIGFQLTRADVFSPWALHPALHPIQVVLEIFALLLAAAVAFVPRERPLTRVCALAGAVTIAIQLPAAHWYYYYIMWFVPFALVGLLVRPAAVCDAAVVDADPPRRLPQPDHPEPALARA